MKKTACDIASDRVKAIRGKYSTPMSNNDETGKADQYCVLGAAGKYLRAGISRFPNGESAAEALGIPRVLADEITELNDNYDFEKAWKMLEAAFAIKEIEKYAGVRL